MHRDLRWENVLNYSTEGDKWFLIDFDEETSSPAAKITHFKAESHARYYHRRPTRSRLTFGALATF